MASGRFLGGRDPGADFPETRRPRAGEFVKRRLESRGVEDGLAAAQLFQGGDSSGSVCVKDVPAMERM
jgi:hypothetical protein